MKRISIFLALIFLSNMWGNYGYAETVCSVPLIRSPNVAPFFGKDSCPVVGRIGNIKLEIPQNYILGPVAYKGVDIWNYQSFKDRPKNPTLDTEIDNFSIRIRFANFQPIESQKDWNDYASFGMTGYKKQSPENKWVYVRFSKGDKESTRKKELNYWLNGSSFIGNYKKTPPMWGLDHYVSGSKLILGAGVSHRYEIFYDAKNDSIFISCEISVGSKDGSTETVSCQADYSIINSDIMVNVSSINYIDDISQWKRIVDGVDLVFKSFVMK